jgi:hypothetical protein
VFLGLTRGEAALAFVVFVLVYGGVVLPPLGERLAVFLASRTSRGGKGPTHRANEGDDGDHQG